MKQINTLFLLIILMFSMIGCGKNIQATWQEQYDLGMRYLTEGNYEEAILSFTAAIEIDPKRVEAYIGRGDAYIIWSKADENVLLEKSELALVDYLTAIELNDQNAEIYLKVAEIYIALDDMEAAKALLENGYAATNDTRLQVKLEEITENLEDGFFKRVNYVPFEELSASAQDYINRMISSIEAEDTAAVCSMLTQDQFAEIVRSYEYMQRSNTFVTKNDKYKIELHHERDNGQPHIEAHSENGNAYFCYYYDMYGDIEFTFLKGGCADWNWNGSYESNTEIIQRTSEGWESPIYNKGTAVNGLVHGDTIAKYVRGTETMISERQYNMGIELSHKDSISGEWPVEYEGYLMTPSGGEPDDDPSWWDWNK